MKYLSRSMCAIIFLFIFLAKESYGQDTMAITSTTRYWVSLGLGGGTKGIASGLNLTFVYHSHSVSFRSLGINDLEVARSPSERIGDISLLYGTVFTGDKTLLRIAAGVGKVTETFRGELLYSSTMFIPTQFYTEGKRSSIGFPFEIQFISSPFASFGAGIYGFANVNSLESYWGGLVTIYVGKLW